MLQCFFSVLQCVAVCCSALQCVAVCCSVLQCVAVHCSVLQCVWRDKESYIVMYVLTRYVHLHMHASCRSSYARGMYIFIRTSHVDIYLHTTSIRIHVVCRSTYSRATRIFV